MFRRIRAALLGAALVTGAVALAPATGAVAAGPVPDLGMAKLTDLYVAKSGNQVQLRFSATIVNVGAAPFELAASRSSTASSFSSHQLHADGTTSPTSAGFVYGGDGHDHWHVQDLEHYELQRLDNGVKVGTSAKSGFCFFDTTPYRLSLPGAPDSAAYSSSGCGKQDALDITMGLSIGWGDTYHWRLPDQFIDITGLANGKYRLVATADPAGLFTESSRANNTTWVDISLNTRKNGTSVRVLGYGPTA